MTTGAVLVLAMGMIISTVIMGFVMAHCCDVVEKLSHQWIELADRVLSEVRAFRRQGDKR